MIKALLRLSGGPDNIVEKTKSEAAHNRHFKRSMWKPEYV